MKVEERVTYAFDNLQFYRIKYDPYKIRYYRIHKDETEEETRDGKNYFMVMDENFEELSEFKLDKNLALNFFISEKGVHFFKNN